MGAVAACLALVLVAAVVSAAGAQAPGGRRLLLERFARFHLAGTTPDGVNV
jgi:hypothetical protein